MWNMSLGDGFNRCQGLIWRIGILCLSIVTGCAYQSAAGPDAGRDGAQAPPPRTCRATPECDQSQVCVVPRAGGISDSGVMDTGDAGPDVSTSDADVDGGTDGSQGEDSGSPTDASMPLGVCECVESNCGPKGYCISLYSVCVQVDCDPGIPCAAGNNPLYCDYQENKCHRTDGICDANYDCPSLAGWLPSDSSVSCVPRSSESGECMISRPPPATPAQQGVSSDLRFLAPPDGTTFGTFNDLMFEYTGSNLVTFVLVAPGDYADAAEFAQHAVWGAISPETAPSDQTRTVRWSDGRAIVDGVWQETAAPLPDDTDLFVALYALDGDSIVQVGDQLLRVRIGTAWPNPLDPCMGIRSSEDETGGCLNPTVSMTCVGTTCRQLCLGPGECLSRTQCAYDSVLGLMYCQ